ncbi:MAG: hypothetical protein WCG18_03760, partial [Acidimicrobiaceae bacterium]
MSDTTIRTAERIELLIADTSEGAQELKHRNVTGRDELGRELGSVLRIDGLTLDPNSIDFDRNDDETM